jgi:hypothetical protein
MTHVKGIGQDTCSSAEPLVVPLVLAPVCQQNKCSRGAGFWGARRIDRRWQRHSQHICSKPGHESSKLGAAYVGNLLLSLTTEREWRMHNVSHGHAPWAAVSPKVRRGATRGRRAEVRTFQHVQQLGVAGGQQQNLLGCLLMRAHQQAGSTLPQLVQQ